MTSSPLPAFSIFYIGFRTGLDSLTNRTFGLNIENRSQLSYSISAAVTTTIAMKILNQSLCFFDTESPLWKFTSSQDSFSKLPLTFLYLSCLLGTALTSRTIGNIAGKYFTGIVSQKSISNCQIEKLNVSAIGVSISTLLTATACAVNYYTLLHLKSYLTR